MVRDRIELSTFRSGVGTEDVDDLGLRLADPARAPTATEFSGLTWAAGLRASRVRTALSAPVSRNARSSSVMAHGCRGWHAQRGRGPARYGTRHRSPPCATHSAASRRPRGRRLAYPGWPACQGTQRVIVTRSYLDSRPGRCHRAVMQAARLREHPGLLRPDARRSATPRRFWRPSTAGRAVAGRLAAATGLHC